mmetsp:Transcript_1774/g.4446  ORF Transcript_1774/g.4446 Transcript_1774/m.4446 type:complete len:425 (-) Transcript_1774:349-1623(-)
MTLYRWLALANKHRSDDVRVQPAELVLPPPSMGRLEWDLRFRQAHLDARQLEHRLGRASHDEHSEQHDDDRARHHVVPLVAEAPRVLDRHFVGGGELDGEGEGDGAAKSREPDDALLVELDLVGLGAEQVGDEGEREGGDRPRDEAHADGEHDERRAHLVGLWREAWGVGEEGAVPFPLVDELRVPCGDGGAGVPQSVQPEAVADEEEDDRLGELGERLDDRLAQLRAGGAEVLLHVHHRNGAAEERGDDPRELGELCEEEGGVRHADEHDQLRGRRLRLRKSAESHNLEEERDDGASQHADGEGADEDEAEGADGAQQLPGGDGSGALRPYARGHAQLHDGLEEDDRHRIVEHRLAEDESVQLGRGARPREDGERGDGVDGADQRGEGERLHRSEQPRASPETEVQDGRGDREGDQCADERKD